MSHSRRRATQLRAPIDRRRFLQLAGGAAGITLISQLSATSVHATPRFRNYPFTLGVASGDPFDDSVVLWTRLAPDPLNGGGMPKEHVLVRWELAADENFRRVLRQGTEIASPALGHSVHATVNGLGPYRTYWYRFKVGNEISPVGRTQTMPTPAMSPSRLRFAFASCQNYSQGYYNAYAAMAEEDLDLVIHLGDYIYESVSRPGSVRQHEDDGEPLDVVGYRNRYAQYRLDPHLQATHAAFPWITTWDDHEVDNDYANNISQDFEDPAAFLDRRAAAYQVYYEMMPLRETSLPIGPDMRIYRRFQFGRLAEFNVLDTRQYRDDQACPTPERGGGRVVDITECPEIFDPTRTLLGREQEQWLLDGLGQSQAQWNVLAQQVLFATLEQNLGPGRSYWTDGWSGYWPSRQRIIDRIAAQQPSNPIIITGDIHTSWVNDILVDFANPHSQVVATEFTGTSISSNGSNFALPYLVENPHVKYHEWRYRGYVRCEVNQQLWRTDFRHVDSVQEPGAPVRTDASWVVEDGQPGAQRDS
ncbi:MAG: alkaline phosphatase [Chloroflexi bacterium AL-W]|nr:alkaline phosphatase [Chloroflexi bacterium AL-N1]NOK65836.1 alkaline phosphatase [Chloroflexi bacterium AL-N10]NOK74223.1 alkaline phosphatase [Chloroflexi bacterium AL-N5]NOK80869.1 alkaline phosphatase [Chloroflexi bacterium AL-W]NOK88481.1 alkaline phosphatase [Chloroflexi bacterium AL-N15]